MDPYVGEIRMFAGDFAPDGWLVCDGRELAIQDNETLFALLRTTYGGDGATTFRLPDLRGRVPVHHGTTPSGTAYPLGATGGVEEVTLVAEELPVHAHAFYGSKAPGTTDDPTGHVLADAPPVADAPAVMAFREISPAVQLNTAAALRPAGGGQPHGNVQPSLCLTFMIATEGVAPTPEED
jgi:microcystin-dependent protein